ncbi:transposase [Pedobacter sp. MC2016-05]|uniref:transposase n=1 Tax=Pedobacter sp. MC2016-05 TaxID=2994474 RepID=UPI002247F593|nr:transposase [Pedobacter sp. MC2016-05]MCX2473465.1 transposase [Pedobacter sp. MC2016-05]
MPAFKQARTFERARSLAMGVLGCLGRCTITGILSANGNQFRDWSAAYRLFKDDRMNLDCIFGAVRRGVQKLNFSLKDTNIYGHMDDTLFRKKGKNVFGTSWLRDPLGPPFANNFVWGQRFIQVSLSLLENGSSGSSKAIPVDLVHCPATRKPGKNSSQAEVAAFKETQKKAKLSEIGIQRIVKLRTDLDSDGHAERKLIMSVDGSYTNETVIRKLPDNVDLIGRIRKDCKLYALPCEQPQGSGRKKYYGEELPTPEMIRQNLQYPYMEVKAWAAGKIRSFDVKVIRNIRWRKSGQKNLMLVIVRPVGYRLTKKSKLLYRNPAYLICTNPEMEISTLLQSYIRRWEIEVGFRDQKTLIGCGQAQVRLEGVVEKVPAFISACYGMMLLAAHETDLAEKVSLPGTKWYNNAIRKRTTTGDILNRFRAEKWMESIKINFSDFVNIENKIAKLEKLANPVLSSLFYMRN